MTKVANVRYCGQNGYGSEETEGQLMTHSRLSVLTVLKILFGTSTGSAHNLLHSHFSRYWCIVTVAQSGPTTFV